MPKGGICVRVLSHTVDNLAPIPNSVSGCGDLGDPINGQVFLTGTTPGALATYICNNGFRLEGSRNRVCQVNGEWSSEEPTCTRKFLMQAVNVRLNVHVSGERN